MKPGKPLRRKTGLKRDTEKAREFLQRGRASSALNTRSIAIQPRAYGKAKRTHPVARARVFARSLGMCIVCLHDAGIDLSRVDERRVRELWERGVIRAARTPHHVFPKRMWPLLAANPDGQVDICPQCHDLHERAIRRIPRAALPSEVFELATRFPELQRYLEKTYPGES